MHNLLNELTELLKKDDRLFVDDNLLKNKVTELAYKLDKDLIGLLLSNERIKELFFVEVDGTLVFNQSKFQTFISNKEFLPDSYTTYKNKIGLTTNDEFISQKDEVVLSFPYKDCVLEGGQNKDDVRRDEVFYNRILASDEIDRLFEPKVLTNFKTYSKDGESDVNSTDIRDNLIIKGNNLLVLHSLKAKYSGKIKLIYIDPPYNPPSNSNTFIYNNSFNHSTWLTFMKNRLEVAKELLTKDGALVVAIDDNEQAYLGVLLDEIFKEYEKHCITIVHNPRGVQGTNFSYTHEYAFFVIPRGRKTITDRIVDEERIEFSNFRNWGGESLRGDAKNCFYPVIVENGEVIGFGDVLDDDFHPEQQTISDDGRFYVYPIDTSGVERKWRYARQSADDVQHLLRAKKTNSGYEIEIGKDFGTYKTVWIDNKYDANEYGTKIVNSLVPDNPFDFPKSLWNVYDCLYAVVGDDKEAIILDFFAGSGTTAHAVLEMNKQDGGSRRFIISEQMDYVDTITTKRVHEVVKRNEEGSFVRFDLLNSNQNLMNEINDTSNLVGMLEVVKNNGFLTHKVDIEKLDVDSFSVLPEDEQRRLLLEILDANHLYVNLSEMDDERFDISEHDKELNRQFYSL